MSPQIDDITDSSINKNTQVGLNVQLNGAVQKTSSTYAQHEMQINDDSNNEIEYEPASCMRQTIALVRKNILNKMRTPVGTIIELVSPAIFMLILLLGYNMSEETFVEVGKYDKWEFALPNDFLTDTVIDVINGIGNGDRLGNNTMNFLPRRHLLEQNLKPFDHLFDYDETVEQDELDDWRVGNSKSNLFQWETLHRMSRTLQTTNGTEEEENDNDPLGFEDIAGSLDGLRRELRKLMRSPFPIPTLSQYIALSQTFSTQFNPDDLDSVFQNTDLIRRWGNLLTLGTIHLTPRGNLVNEFIEHLRDVHNIHNISSSSVLEDSPNGTSVMIRVHDDAESSTEYVMNNLDERTFVAIHFDENENENFKYTMRMNSTTLPNTNSITSWISIGLNTKYERYFFSGYLSLQRTVNEFAIWRSSNTVSSTNGRKLETDQCAVPDSSSWDVYSIPMPTPAYSQNPFFTAVGFLLGLVMAMSFLYPVSRLIKAMVEEKETRMKETLSILGVRPLAQWFSWIITASISSLIISILVTWTLSGVLIHSSSFYVFVYILLFTFAVSGFAFFISSLFSRANLAAIVGPIGLFVTVLPRWIFFGTNRYEATFTKKWASLLPCTAFAFGADILSDYEYAQVGIQGDNLSDGDYNFNTTLGFLFFDAILYVALGWYLEQAIPRQFGVARKWYFPLTPSFWREIFGLGRNKSVPNNFSDDGVNVVEDGTVESVQAQAKLCIQNLVKIYNPKKPPAINDLNLSMYESEITCLLGHNGAGKSSTISVLTGLYPPTSGDCIIYGKSILHDLVKCRQSMGICPQQNVLFNNLTVLEHLRFFGSIKGLPTHDVEDRAREVGLGDFFHTRAGQLSGGNKRKLQLAIALAGTPKIVLLDEPTSGMDPYSRRATWELLRKKRHGKIILLTTHYMDEAEVLADRVAILKEGRLQCCGSLLFLKQRFGLGYNITVMVEKLAEDSMVTIQDVQANVSKLLERFVPGTRFIRVSARELVYRFPPGSESYFPSLFDALEKSATSSHVSSYGVSNTSLEEVFLELSEDADEDKGKEGGVKSVTESNQGLILDNWKYLGSVSQVSLLMNKRFTIQKRDLKGLFFKIALPVIIICLVLMILLIEIPIEGTPIELTAELYNTSGTGASIGNSMIVAGSRLNQVDMFVNTMEGVYPSVEMQRLTDLRTSADVSEYILEGLQENRREFNFGSFVFGDNIKAKLDIDWNQFNSDGDALLPLIDNLIFSQLSSSDAINVLNQTVSFLNVTGGELYITLVNEILENGGSLPEVIDQTVSFFDIDIEQIEKVVLNNLFDGVDDVSLGGQNWKVSLSEESVESFFNGGNATYNMTLDVPVSIMHNTSSSHSIAVFTQTYYDYLYKTCSETSQAKLTSINYPLPLTSQQSTEIRTILSVIASILLTIPFNYIPAAFAVFVVKERACKSKHLQLVSGVNMLSYWVSTYIWDFTLYMILAVFTMLGFLSFGDVSVVFTGSLSAFCCTFSIIVGYGLSSLPFSYLLSRLFDNPPNAQISIMIIFFVTGFVAVNAYLIMESIETTRKLAKILQPLFRTWPAYNLGQAFINLAANFWERQITSNTTSPFSWDACGEQLLLLYILSVPYFLWLMFLEFSSDGGSGGKLGTLMRSLRAVAHRLHNRLSGFRGDLPNETDDDVVEEERFVNEDSVALSRSSPVVIAALWKVFPKRSLLSMLCDRIISTICCCIRKCNSNNSDIKQPKVAVKNLSFHVENGITMGLLGVNGAGKTTTMGILTGDITPTSGEAFVASNNVTGRTQDGVQLARQNIGFCPQVDPLLDLMTGRETLSMFGRLRGIPSDVLDVVVNDLLDRLTLTPHADKVAQNYSGGNKRKLSLGVALIGNPQVLFIDESSSGMDPKARRKIWDLLSEAAKDRAVILTTHSMEEAEALCSKIAIMIKGRIRCLGGVQHLKQKFLGGYTVSISCEGNRKDDDIDLVEKEVLKLLPSAALSERHGNYLKFEVSGFGSIEKHEPQVRSLGELFSFFQDMVESEESCVASYSISQCTIEQVFINLVKEEEEDRMSS